jgi:hypothetical protein
MQQPNCKHKSTKRREEGWKKQIAKAHFVAVFLQ